MTGIPMPLKFLPAALAVLAMTMWRPAPLAAQPSKIFVVDMERAIVQSAAGKKAELQFNARFEELRKTVDKKQKELEDAQNKLKLQEKTLSDAVKADLNGSITRLQTELTRTNQDAQKELDAMRNDLMRPIAEVAERVVKELASDQGATLTIDVSNPQNESLLGFSPKADITDELIRRIDAEMQKAPPPNKPR